MGDDPKIKSEVYHLLGGRNSKSSPYDTGPTQFRDLVNLNFVQPGALTQRPGTSLFVGATVSGFITGAIEFQRLSGASYLVATANTNAYTVSGGAFNSFQSGLLNNALFSFVTFVDRLFAANGQDYFKWDGTNLNGVGLPAGITVGFGVGPSAGGSLTSGVTTTFLVNYGYFNNRNYFGPVSSGYTVVLDGTTNNSISYSGMTIPSGYGISGVVLYKTTPNGGVLTGSTTIIGQSLPPGATITDQHFFLGSRIQSQATQFTLIPRYLELFNNQLMLAGFSGFPSTLYFSEIGEPEAIDPQNFIEFRTNDGDRITGIKSYLGKFIIGKQRSLHEMQGTDPNTFNTAELTNEYGVLSHRAMLVYNNQLVFLDSKGICQYDGTNTHIVSTPVEDVFTRMNVDAAVDNATSIHYKTFNEVWFAIPVDGATFNNLIVVYDYLSDGWTTYKGINPALLFLAKQNFVKKELFVGGYTGALSFVGSTIVNDNGQAITCTILTRFEATAGQSQERMYRRLYINVNPVMGFTLPIQTNFRSNYGSTVVFSTTLYTTPFQSRIDFGIPGRSIQAEMIYASASFPLTMFGYTWESRHQRDV